MVVEQRNSHQPPQTNGNDIVLHASDLKVDVKGQDADTPAELNQLDRPERSPLPTWTRTFAIAVGVLRTTMERNKGSLWRARLLTTKAATPVPFKTCITKVYIPRRQDALPEGMSPKDARGSIKGEWLDWGNPPSHLLRSRTSDQALDAPADERVILYLHGGAYFICSRKTHRGLTYRAAKYAKARVLAVDYRLSPEATFPLPLADTISAYLYLIDPPASQPFARRYRPDQISFMGDSAGGALALSTILWLRDHRNPDGSAKWSLPATAVLLSPWLDLTHSMPSWRLNNSYDYLPDGPTDPKHVTKTRQILYLNDDTQRNHPLASPFFGKEDPSRPLPPILIQAGDAEKLRDESIYFAAHNFKNSDIRVELYEDQPHVFQMFAGMEPIGKVALKRAAEWIIQRTSVGSDAASSPSSPLNPINGDSTISADSTKIPTPCINASSVRVVRTVNRAPYPTHPVYSPLDIIATAKSILISRGQWSKTFNKPQLSRGDSAFMIDPDVVKEDEEVAQEMDKLAVGGGTVTKVLEQDKKDRQGDIPVSGEEQLNETKKDLILDEHKN
ncbi:Alpha/Beta hydrolase protein [Phlyctochytrium arcticum]|nr:Alpha/Beta hydrolase protein [Phlyctochytrium arcticum]